MRTKRIYTKAIGISEEDREYIKKLLYSGKFKNKTMSGILAEIINKYKNEL